MAQLTKSKEYPLFNYQSNAIKRAEGKTGLALFHDPGLGKTRTTLEIYKSYRKITPNLKLIVVCPVYLIEGAWVKNIEEWTLCSYATPKQRELFRGCGSAYNPDIHIINYKKVITRDRFYAMKRFMENHQCMLVLDESQRIKSPTIKTTRALMKLGQSAKHRLIMSGTPAPNGEYEYWSQMEFLHAGLIGYDNFLFKKEFFHMNFRGSYIPLSKYGMGEYYRRGGFLEIKEGMRKKLFGIMAPHIDVVGDTVLDLPESIFIERSVPLTPKESKAYIEMAKNKVAEINAGEHGIKLTADTALTKVMALRQITSGFAYHTNKEKDVRKSTIRIGDSKLNSLMELLSELEGRQVIVFTNFTEEVHRIQKALEKAKITFSTLYGGTEDKDKSVRDFSDGTSRILVANTRVGGVGLDFTNCSHMVFFSLTYSLGDYIQAVGRIHRAGQRNTCFYYTLLAKAGDDETVDHKVSDVLAGKKTVSDLLAEFMRNYA